MEVDGKHFDYDVVSELCEPCQEGNVSTQPDGHCSDCEEYMCQTCFQSHVKMKLGRNHVLWAVDAGRNQGKTSQAKKCKKHKTENIKYYCRNHDSVACGDCLVFDHRKCEPEFIRELAKNFEESTDFTNSLNDVDNLADFKAEIELSLARNKRKNTELHDKAKHEIQNFRAEISIWLEHVTSKIEAEEMEIWKENEIMLSKLEDWIKIIRNMTNKVRGEICTEKYNNENLFIRVIECKSEIREFASISIPEMKSILNIKPFIFEPNQSLFLLTKSTNLGVINVGDRNKDLQTRSQKGQNDFKLTFIDGTSSAASSNLLGPEVEHVGPGKRSTSACSELIVRLQQEISSLKSQLDSRIHENEIVVSKSKARQEQDHNTIKSLKSKLKKLRLVLQQTGYT